MEIRTIKANEIDARIGMCKEKGLTLLLYKDARYDMKILDELFTPLGWQRKHNIINGNLFCTVSVYNEKLGQWIDKEDVGTESNTEKEKGQASDSFKRACVNLGIGRELYTAGFIWVANKGDIFKDGNRYKCNTKFKVDKIEYNADKEIISLVIKDDKGNIRHTMGKPATEPTPPPQNKPQTDPKAEPKKINNAQIKRAYAIASSAQLDDATVKAWIKTKFKKESLGDLVKKEYDELCNALEIQAKKLKENTEG